MKKRGFTLIELMIVMMIIAILIGIALPRVKGMQDEANSSKAKMELKSIQTAIESWYVNQSPNVYPATSTTVCQDDLNSASPLIIGEVLYDSFASEEEYDYILSDNGAYYVVFSLGLDRTAQITGISDDGDLEGNNGDDIYATNGTGWNE